MPTAEDMAEYILSTGDQQTVAQLIEAMVEGGEVSYLHRTYVRYNGISLNKERL